MENAPHMKRRIPLVPLLLVEAIQIVSFLNFRPAMGSAGILLSIGASLTCAGAFGVAVVLSDRSSPWDALAGYWLVKLGSALLALPFTGWKGFEFLPFIPLGLGTTAAILSAVVAGMIQLANHLLHLAHGPSTGQR